MTVAGSVAGRRYQLQDLDGREGEAERWAGYDERLGRPVVLWTLEGEETDPAREELLTIARVIARNPDPSLLRVLDVVPERQQLTIVLEMPEAPPDEQDAGLPAITAARTILELAEALDAVQGAGVPLARLSGDYLHHGGDGGVRADPIGLFLPARSRVTPSAAPLVDLLRRIAETRAPASDRPAPVADEQLRRMLARWERRDGDLSLLIDDLREIVGAPRTAPAPVAPEPRLEPGPGETTEVFTPWAPPEPGPEAPSRSRERDRRLRIAVPAGAAALAILLAVVGLVIASQFGTSPGRLDPDGDSQAGPPVSTPAANRVTVGLQAQEPTNLRVTVDGVVQFDGVLPSGGRQLWEGTDRIQVWTDRGQTLLLSVNGEDLGPYSPAMSEMRGDPTIATWNRIDFGFWPGWPN